MYVRTMYGSGQERLGQETVDNDGRLGLGPDLFHLADNPAIAVTIDKLDGSSDVWTYVREPELDEAAEYEVRGQCDVGHVIVGKMYLSGVHAGNPPAERRTYCMPCNNMDSRMVWEVRPS